MPSGRVRWFDANKGYGFIQNEQGADVFLPAAALPEGVKTLRKGVKVESYACRVRPVSGQGDATEAG